MALPGVRINLLGESTGDNYTMGRENFEASTVAFQHHWHWGERGPSF